MPATMQAARETDSHRREIVLLRATYARTIRRSLLAAPLDGSERDIEEYLFRRWVEDSSRLLTAAQSEAVASTAGYLGRYLTASGVQPTWAGPESPAVTPTSDALTGAAAALLWRLGRGDGRAAALLTGTARAARVANESIQSSVRDTMAEGMAAELRVTKYRRVGSSNPCGGCLGLIGEESTSEKVGLPYHLSCGCSAEPVVSGVAETVRRPTGQQMFDSLDETAQARLFAGSGGAEKAAMVRERGVSSLVTFDRSGSLVEAQLRDLAA